jgi:hypothetical protein
MVGNGMMMLDHGLLSGSTRSMKAMTDVLHSYGSTSSRSYERTEDKLREYLRESRAEMDSQKPKPKRKPGTKGSESTKEY